MRNDRQLPGTDVAQQKCVLSSPYCLFAWLFFAALTCSSCQSPLPALPNPPGPHTAVRLAPGDVIKLTFAEESDLDQTQKIRRDGKVSLPLVGEIRAAGKRVIDFQHEVTSLYEDKLDNPEVLVMLETGSANVIISGFANKPGKYVFDRPTTVYQTINLRPNIRGDPTIPEYVQDGDVIYISRSLF
jgi:protein involved in polysaccharide export with SLBB domain